jgi:hypothetical protein
MQGRKAYGSVAAAADSRVACFWLAESQQDRRQTMQISLEELRKVAQAYRRQRAVVQPLEPVPAPFVAPKAEDERLAREIARMLANTPDIRSERVQEASQSLHHTPPAKAIAVAIMRRTIADNITR